MQINFLGHSCFKIRSKDIVILVDPFDKSIGFSMSKTRADIVAISHNRKGHCCLEGVEGTPFVIRAPGEYEISGVFVVALPSFSGNKQGEEKTKNIINIITVEEVRLCHLGSLENSLTDRQLEEINGVDVLFIPVGGDEALGPKEAKELIAKVAPKIAIPMHFKTAESNDSLAVLDEFLKEMGIDEPKKEEKLTINKSNLSEETEIIVLEKK